MSAGPRPLGTRRPPRTSCRRVPVLPLPGFVVFSELRQDGEALAVLATRGFVLALFGCVGLHELAEKASV